MQRTDFIKQIEESFSYNPVVALLGPRQCGKTTLAKQYLKLHPEPTLYFDLENPTDLARLSQPMLAFENHEGLIVIDEIQLRPDLFPILRVLVDSQQKCKFLILGSASRDLINQSSETLAGRITYIECTPFNLIEAPDINKLTLRGGFPKSYLATSNNISCRWRQDYIKTFLERDIPNLGFKIPAATMRRFWLMLTHYHGQNFNSSELGKSLGIAHTTVRNYLDILTGTFMIRELLPWQANLNKRQVKTPKIYFRDSGIYLALLGIENKEDLYNHPKLGATWEGFAMEQIISMHKLNSEECFFWSIHQQAELDLFVNLNGKKVGFEFKYSDAPKLTKSMQTALELLELDQLIVIYPGKGTYKLQNEIEVVGLSSYMSLFFK